MTEDEKDATITELRAEVERLDAHYRDWQAALQDEYRKAAETWDRSRERLNGELAESRDEVATLRAGIEGLAEKWAEVRETTHQYHADDLRALLAPSPAEPEECRCGHSRRPEHYTDSITEAVMCVRCECREYAPVSSGEAALGSKIPGSQTTGGGCLQTSGDETGARA